MREEPSDLIDDLPVNGESPQESTPARAVARSDPPSTGFTAVNGDSQRSTSFRPDDAIGLPTTSNDNNYIYGSITMASGINSHGWRPDERSAPEKRAEISRDDRSTSHKRKRPHPKVVDPGDDFHRSESHGDGRSSPKRRVMPLLDSAIDLTSPERTDERGVFFPMEHRPEPAPLGPYVRERSPVARWNQGEPPPKPRPETEASLAESLHKFQQTQQLQRPEQSQPDPAEKDESPENEQEDQAVDEDHSQSDNSDPKKRKRNFSNRTKTGCHTCRGRKKKCDERHPTCFNCERGGFVCGGYGPKPPGWKLPRQSRAVVPLQSKVASYEPLHGPTGHYWPNPEEGGRSYSHWGRTAPEPEPPRHYIDPTIDPKRLPSRESWQQKPPWAPYEPPPHMPGRLPGSDFHLIPPPHAYGIDHQMPNPLPPPPPSQRVDPFGSHLGLMDYRYPNGPGSLHGSESLTSSSQRTAHLALNYGQPTEKDKMLRGQPYRHWLDSTLLKDRQDCAAVLQRYNNATDPSSGISRDQQATFFTQILQPQQRTLGAAPHKGGYAGPTGSIEENTIVETPFRCDYGYNIHIGKDSVIQTGCHMQDAGDITLGERTIVGPNVKFYTMTANNDSSNRKGSQGVFKTGAIKVEDDVFIGGDVIILPFVTIGKGAVVGAGSVVTRVCFSLSRQEHVG